MQSNNKNKYNIMNELKYNASDTKVSGEPRPDTPQALELAQEHAETATAAGNKTAARQIEIEIDIPSYDSRRYGFPWIARIVFDDNKDVYNWGLFRRETATHGDGGKLLIPATIGDIIAHGQKERGGDGRWIEYSVVTGEGTLQRLANKDEARRVWKQAQHERQTRPSSALSEVVDERTALNAKLHEAWQKVEAQREDT